jgi:DNA replication and repair protein RecF
LLVSLTARGFRNLQPLVWHPGPGSHLLIGGNGAGKTSLLEAIYVLATTKSFRTAQLADCARFGGEDFHLAGEVEGAARQALTVDWSRGADKARAINGKPSPLAAHLAALPLVVWTAADADLLTGAPALRRRFLDRGAVGLRPTLLDTLARYRRALRAKRDLLAGGAFRDDEIAPWNQLLAEAGADVIAHRRRYVDRLAGELAAALELAGLPFPPVEISYRPSPSLAAGEEASAAALAERLRRAAPRERSRRLPLVGPHRDDLEVRWGGRPLRGTVSAGERKALGLLLHAAHGRVLTAGGHPPLHLLDDADAELAAPTLAAVWRAFAGARQLIASSNRPRVWEAIEVDVVHPLEGGRLSSRGEPAVTS